MPIQSFIGPLINTALVLYAQVATVKRNKRYCRRLVDEIRALEPILRDIGVRAETFSEHSKGMLVNALELLQQDFQETVAFLNRQRHIGTIKKFVVARTIEEEFTDLSAHFKNSREIFLLAMVNKIDDATSRNIPNTLPTVHTPPLTRSISKPLPTIPQKPRSKLEDMRKAFEEKQYEQAIAIGKEVLKATPKTAEESYIVYLSIACSYACLDQCEDALTYLVTAKENGWKDIQFLDCDDFASLRSYPEFISLKDELTKAVLQAERWRALPEEQVDQLTRLFDRYDTDGSGTISKAEFRVLMKRTSRTELTDDDITTIFSKIDNDNSGEVVLNEYLNYMADNKTDISSNLLSSTNSFLDVKRSLPDLTDSLSDLTRLSLDDTPQSITPPPQSVTPPPSSVTPPPQSVTPPPQSVTPPPLPYQQSASPVLFHEATHSPQLHPQHVQQPPFSPSYPQHTQPPPNQQNYAPQSSYGQAPYTSSPYNSQPGYTDPYTSGYQQQYPSAPFNAPLQPPQPHYDQYQQVQNTGYQQYPPQQHQQHQHQQHQQHQQQQYGQAYPGYPPPVADYSQQQQQQQYYNPNYNYSYPQQNQY